MTSRPQLSVIIATHTPLGLQRVERMALPRLEGVEYVVSWQAHGNAPVPESLLKRPDIAIHRFDMPGLSNNRNNAIRHARGEVCLNADDDVIYTAANLTDIIDTFRENPQVDLAVFRYAGKHNRKFYPAESTDLATVPRNFNPSGIEMAFRRKITSGPRALSFSPRFGPGAGYLTAAEDLMFFLAARRRHLNCRYFPITICVHDSESTGSRKITDNGVLRADGAIIALTHPLTFPARIAVNAMRTARKRRARFLTALGSMLAGAFFALRKKEIRNSVFFPGD